MGQLVRWFLTKHHVDVVLSEYLDFSVRWLDITRDLGVPFFAHAHGYDVSTRLRDPAWRETYLRYNAADGVITPSALSRQRLIEIGLEPSKVTSIPYGVDVPEKPPHRKPDEYIRCTAIGRAVPKKGILFTLEAFRLAAADIPHLRLDVIGDGELLPAARQYVHKFALERNVTFHGAQPAAAVKNMLARTDIFLQHSVVDTETGDEEGLPVVILEAMAQAVPVVSTKHAGIPEEVIDGVTGYLVEERDSSAMSERIVALARDDARRGSIGEAGWERVKSAFSWNIERSRLLRELGIHDERVPCRPEIV